MRLDDLPIFPFLPEIAGALRRGSLVLSAETGAGKTTAVPAYLAERGQLSGKVIVLEPRRLAAVSAASRVAELLGGEPGGIVGYRVRGDSRAGPRTVIEFVTEAVFIRMVQDDPLLSGVCMVAFDEFHERSAMADLGLAFAAEAGEARGGLSILVMSATMDTAAVSAFLACPAIAVPGRLFPVDLSYSAPLLGERVEQAVTRAITVALGATGGDILAFVPGLREIGAVATCLRAMLDRGKLPVAEPVAILGLHGSMPLRDQRAIVAPPPGSARRVIVSTSIAETSLTLPRITAVVDSGLSRYIRHHVPSGLNRLVTGRVSAAEADQRKGRAGRLGPGLCIRCWDRTDILASSRGKELERIELAGVVLECAARGARSMEAVRWLDPPPRHAWEAACVLLRSIGLIDAEGAATKLGERAVGIGTDPRAATALLLSASSPPCLHATALAVAALSEREGQESSGDFAADLEAILDSASRRNGDRARGDRAFGTDQSSRILEEASRLVSRVWGTSPGRDSFDPVAAREAMGLIGDLLAPGFPDRLARSLADGNWEFASGRQAQAAFAAPRTEWMLAVDVDAGDQTGYIRRGIPVGHEAAETALLPGSTVSAELEWRGLAASAWERRRNGVIVLGERRLAVVPADALQAAFAARLGSEGLKFLPWNDDSRSLVDRIRFIVARKALPALGDDAGGWNDESLAAKLAAAAGAWLSPSGPVIDAAGFRALLESLLGREILGAVDAAAPPFMETPGGRRRRPQYPQSGPARLSGRIQEFFGVAESPRACGEALTLELLTPADRPIQVTSDLASFWSVAYPAIRAEMARRYPRHFWPENPLGSEATRGLKPRPAS